jgi:DNA-binding MarR family transcriptional regulator
MQYLPPMLAAGSIPWCLLQAPKGDRMKSRQPEDLVDELLGSANVFVSALSGVMEQKLLTEIAGKELTLSQLKILKLLDLGAGRNIGDVAAFLGVSNAAASKTVDRLVRRKYLRRAENRTDRRSTELSLAAAGQKLLHRYENAKRRKLSQVFGSLDPAEVQRTAEYLERLTKGIVTHSDNPEETCLQCGIYLQRRCLVREVSRTECSYQQRTKKRGTTDHGTHTKTATRSGPRMGPPG